MKTYEKRGRGLHKGNGKGDNLPNEGIYRAKEFDTTWAGPGGGKVHIL